MIRGLLNAGGAALAFVLLVVMPIAVVHAYPPSVLVFAMLAMLEAAR